MSKSTYRTWTVGELITAAMLNQQIRDNGNALWPFTTAGDMVYATGAADLARIPLGAEGDVLSVVGGVPAWHLPLNAITVGQSAGISTNTSSTSFVDVANSSFNLTLSGSSTIILIGNGNVTSPSGSTETIKGVVNGVDQAESIIVIDAGKVLPWSYVVMVQSVPAGTRTVKLQYKTSLNQVNLYNAMLMAIVLP